MRINFHSNPELNIAMCNQQLLLEKSSTIFFNLILKMFSIYQAGKEEERAMFQQMQAMAQKQVNTTPNFLLIQLYIIIFC